MRDCIPQRWPEEPPNQEEKCCCQPGHAVVNRSGVWRFVHTNLAAQTGSHTRFPPLRGTTIISQMNEAARCLVKRIALKTTSPASF